MRAGALRNPAPPVTSGRARYATVETAFGLFAIVEHGDGAMTSAWLAPEAPMVEGAVHHPSLHRGLRYRLARYFRGEDVDFSDVPTPPGPAFRRACWQACRRIPRGSTWTYAHLASEAGGDLRKARAAGQAMRHNPLPVIVPCHRVIASSGSLHGFAGSTTRNGPELTLKAHLLALEGAVEAPLAASIIGRRSAQ